MPNGRGACMGTCICVTCGNHFPDPCPQICTVCADERQWVPPGGQRWTTLAELAAAGHRSDIRTVEPGLTGIGTDPPVAIGQRSLLVSTPEGNLLWDPSGFIDDAAVAAVRSAGGLRLVTASHPHFYGAIASWARWTMWPGCAPARTCRCGCGRGFWRCCPA